MGDIAVKSSRDDCIVECEANVEILVHLDDITDAHVFNVPEDRRTCISSCGIGMGMPGDDVPPSKRAVTYGFVLVFFLAPFTYYQILVDGRLVLLHIGGHAIANDDNVAEHC